mmetsp:Transcript_18172/g.25484  ORF Transcript_18172/g.25484 Transcript_18172/m.25484 type:complete len:134 (-) Transcript_18172:95-496(-)
MYGSRVRSKIDTVNLVKFVHKKLSKQDRFSLNAALEDAERFDNSMPARIKAFQILLLFHPSSTATPNLNNSNGGSNSGGGQGVAKVDADMTAEIEADLKGVREMIWDPDKGEALAVAVAKVEASVMKPKISGE